MARFQEALFGSVMPPASPILTLFSRHISVGINHSISPLFICSPPTPAHRKGRRQQGHPNLKETCFKAP